MLNSIEHDMGAQWLSGRVLDSRPRGGRFEPHRCHCIVSLSKNINPSIVLVQPRKTRSFITEGLLMGRKESNQTNKLSMKLKVNYQTRKLHLVFMRSKFNFFRTWSHCISNETIKRNHDCSNMVANSLPAK